MTQPSNTTALTCTDGHSAGDHLASALEQLYAALFGKERMPEAMEVQMPEVPRTVSHAVAVDYTVS